MNQQRVLVTGAASSLGQAVGRQLKSEGHYSIGTTRTQSSRKELPMFDQLVHVSLEDLVIDNSLSVEFDSLINIAALSTGTPAKLMQVTGIATAVLADLALRRGIRNFIHVSSMSVYGAINVPLVSSKTEIRHSTPYGAAKWAAECYLNSVSGQLPSVSIRSCAIVGRKSHRNFLAEVFKAMMNQTSPVYAANPEFMFNNVIHEDTLAAFMVHLALKHRSGFGAVPVGSLDPIPFKTILETMADRTRFQGTIEWLPPKSPPFSIDITDAIEMGLRPLTTSDTINNWLDDALGEPSRT